MTGSGFTKAEDNKRVRRERAITRMVAMPESLFRTMGAHWSSHVRLSKCS